MQKLRELPTPFKILAFAAAAVVVLGLAAGVGAMAAMTLRPEGDSSQGAKPERVKGANAENGAEQTDRTEDDRQSTRPEDDGGGASDAQEGPAYVSVVAKIQNESVESALRSNARLVRYDGLSADDVEEMKTDYATLEGHARRAKNLAPSAKYENQHRVFVLAIGELRDANELAYRLAADPSTATQSDFETYDRHVDRATAYLRRSNEMLGKDYKTTRAAQETSLG